MPKKSKPDDVEFHEETDSPTYADDRNFYKVEKWTKDGTKVDRLLYAGNSLAKAQELFAWAINHRPRIRLTIIAARPPPAPITIAAMSTINRGVFMAELPNKSP